VILDALCGHSGLGWDIIWTMGEYFRNITYRFKQAWNVWVGVGAGLLAVLICGAAFLLVWVLTPTTVSSDAATRAVVTRLPAPTYTPVVAMTPTPVVDERLLDGIGLGMTVEIFDTGGAGLRFRAEPGIDANIQFIAADQEMFRIEGGPVEEDGFVWWYLVSDAVRERSGWAVASYLQVVE